MTAAASTRPAVRSLGPLTLRGSLEYVYVHLLYMYVFFCRVRSLGHLSTLRDSFEYMYICCICLSVVFGAWISSLAGCICMYIGYIYIVWHTSHLRILFNLLMVGFVENDRTV